MCQLKWSIQYALMVLFAVFSYSNLKAHQYFPLSVGNEWVYENKKTRTYLKGTSYDDQMIIKSVGEDFGAIGVQAFMQGITPDKMIKRTGESLTSVRDALMKDTTLEKGETYVVKITTPKGSTVITWTK